MCICVGDHYEAVCGGGLWVGGWTDTTQLLVGKKRKEYKNELLFWFL